MTKLRKRRCPFDKTQLLIKTSIDADGKKSEWYWCEKCHQRYNYGDLVK